MLRIRAKRQDDFPLWDVGRDKEFEALVHDHATPCFPSDTSKAWSCVRYLSRSMISSRNRSLYGFQPGEVMMHVCYRISTIMASKNAREFSFWSYLLFAQVAENRLYDTFDKTYTAQIPKIPKITPSGAGYLHMTMTDKLKEISMEWYQMRRNDSLIPHGVIAGGYTNNHVVNFDKVDLDRFRAVHSAIVREMQQVLQWWTKVRLRHTSTFGVRVYRRDSMLINHVDRMDTHLASAVLQIHQEVDDDGGWPLEVLLPDGRAAEVYLQPGEMVLYEGAWLRHGRPMRFKGTEFANVFSHFAPLDWRGPNNKYAKKENPDVISAPNYYGFVKGRCTTWADEGSRSRCNIQPSTPYSELEVDLDFGNVDIPEEDTTLKGPKKRGWFSSKNEL